MNNDFVYHRVPKNLKDNILYPLNRLKDIYPEIYNEHVKKYDERKHLLDTEIPILNCLWNDVLHFTAVSPHILFDNLSKAGINPKEITSNQWFQVPITLFDTENTIVCLYKRDISYIPDSRDFSLFDPNRMEEYRQVPLETINYYKDKHNKGERPLLFHKVPHILYKGSIDLNRVTQIVL